METAQTLETDPFDVAMANRHAARIDFEIVEDDPDPPPDTKKEPPSAEEDGSEDAANAPETRITEHADTPRRVPLSEWQRALRDADDLTATEHHIALAYAAHMRYRDKDGPVVEAHAWPGTDVIAKETHRSRSIVYEALAGLEAKGWVYWERRGNSSPVIWATFPDGAQVFRFRPTGHQIPAHRTADSGPPDTEAEAEAGIEDEAAPHPLQEEIIEAALDKVRWKIRQGYPVDDEERLAKHIAMVEGEKLLSYRWRRDEKATKRRGGSPHYYAETEGHDDAAAERAGFSTR